MVGRIVGLKTLDYPFYQECCGECRDEGSPCSKEPCATCRVTLVVPEENVSRPSHYHPEEGED